MLVAATRSNFGPNPKLMKWAYTGVVRASLSYASIIWSHETQTKHIRTQIDKLDRLALLACASVKPSTPTEGLSHL